MTPEATNRAALTDILDYVERVRRHATSSDKLDDELAQAGILRWLGVIGEAANRLSAELRDVHPEVPWRRIIAMRNILIHVYDQVDKQLVWAAIEQLPELQSQIDTILKGLPAD